MSALITEGKVGFTEAFVVHFNELLGYIGSAFVALVPIFIIIAVIIWLLRSIFR